MSAFSDWAKGQAAAMAQGAAEVGGQALSDVGSTYQAFLMSDAGWRVPAAHNLDAPSAIEAPEAIAEAAGREQAAQEMEPPEPEITANLDYC